MSPFGKEKAPPRHAGASGSVISLVSANGDEGTNPGPQLVGDFSYDLHIIYLFQLPWMIPSAFHVVAAPNPKPTWQGAPSFESWAAGTAKTPEDPPMVENFSLISSGQFGNA